MGEFWVQFSGTIAGAVVAYTAIKIDIADLKARVINLERHLFKSR